MIAVNNPSTKKPYELVYRIFGYKDLQSLPKQRRKRIKRRLREIKTQITTPLPQREGNGSTDKPTQTIPKKSTLEQRLDEMSLFSVELREHMDDYKYVRLAYLLKVQYADMLLSPHFAFMGAYDGDKLVALAKVEHTPDMDENVAHIAEISLAVLPAYQRNGVGSYMMGLLEKSLLAIGVKKLRARVVKDNILAINFVKSLGFKEEAVLKHELRAYDPTESTGSAERYVDVLLYRKTLDTELSSGHEPSSHPTQKPK